MKKDSNLAPVKRRNYIIWHTDGLMESRNSEITQELCEYYAARNRRKTWNGEVSKQPKCRHCRDKGWVELEGTPVVTGFEAVLNKRGNIRGEKRGEPRFGPVKESIVRWREACVCVKKQMEKDEQLDADALVMGSFAD